MMRKFVAVLLAAAITATGAWAGSHQGGTLFDGEVRKVDKDAKKITIKHGPMQSLDMPPMTMVFQVKDAALLDQVKAGDKVKFHAEKLGGAFTVTRIEPVR
jgi:Cu(I)/Ag(I) efflux system protein CusF